MAPYQREPMDSVNDPAVQSTCLMWASQLGKTEVVNNVIGYFIDADASPILMVQPTLDLAESWSKIRLAPMLRDCPCFRGKVRDARTRDSGNTILNKSYTGGDIVATGANAPGGLAGRPRRVVLLDEIDRFPASAGSEGDPCPRRQAPQIRSLQGHGTSIFIHGDSIGHRGWSGRGSGETRRSRAMEKRPLPAVVLEALDTIDSRSGSGPC